MDSIVAKKFFKKTQQLPPDESIVATFNCSLEASVKCSGQLFIGRQALYFYSKVNYKTLIGKSTKIRIHFKDVSQVQQQKQSALVVLLSVMRAVGQDLRSTGKSTYKVPTEYIFTGFKDQTRDACFSKLQTSVTATQLTSKLSNTILAQQKEDLTSQKTLDEIIEVSQTPTNEDSNEDFLSSCSNQEVFKSIQDQREEKALNEFEIADINTHFQWHPYSEMIPGVSLQLVVQNLCTYGEKSWYIDYHKEKSNSDHVFVPQQPATLPTCFASLTAKVPSTEEFLKMTEEQRWQLSYTHHPVQASFFKPKVMYFKEEKAVFFLSPFKVYVIERIFGSGFPYSGNFHYIQMWEYEHVVLSKEKPKSFCDIGVSLKFHFGIKITKQILIGTSLLMSESESNIMKTANVYIKDHLRQRLVDTMEKAKQQIKKQNASSEQSTLSTNETETSQEFEQFLTKITQMQQSQSTLSKNLKQQQQMLTQQVNSTQRMIYLVILVFVGTTWMFLL